MERLDANIADPAYRGELQSSLEQLAAFKFALDESSSVAATDSRGSIRYVNDRFCEISQYARVELIGRDHRIINSGFHGEAFMSELWNTIRSGGVWRGEIRNRAKDGSFYGANTTIMPFFGRNGSRRESPTRGSDSTSECLQAASAANAWPLWRTRFWRLSIIGSRKTFRSPGRG